MSTDPQLETNEVGLAGDSALQTEVLEDLAGVPNYQDWLTSLAEPILGDDPIELGSGTGDYAARWLDRGLERIMLTEIDPTRRAVLQERFGGDPRVTIGSLDIHKPHRATHSAMVSFNVLEHVQDDVLALAAAKSVVRPGGYIFHLVPAFPFAMSRFDREIGHFRRYRKSGLSESARAAGLVVDDVRYLNAPGLVAWFVMMRLMRRRPAAGALLKLWDGAVIPVERQIESKIRLPFGQSAILLARTPG